MAYAFLFLAYFSVVYADTAANVISDAEVLQQQSPRGFLTPRDGTQSVAPTPQLQMAQSVTNPVITQPVASGDSGMGSGTLVLVVILITMCVCCVLGCCMMKQVCGCLFGGVEDAFDGDGHIGETAQAEEAALAGLAGYEMAGKSLF